MFISKVMRFQCLQFLVIHSVEQGEEEEEEEGSRSVDSGPTQTGKGALLDLRSFSVILQLNALITTIFKTRQAG